MAKRPIFVTDRGIAKFPWLNRPDTKFNADGDYKVSLVLEGEAAIKLREKIDAELAASVAKHSEEQKGKRDKKGAAIKVVEADPPYRVEIDEASDSPTGRITFSFKVNAVGKSKKTGESWSNKPDLRDAKGNPCPQVIVRGGSTIKVAYELNDWFRATDAAAGVSLRLRGAKIIKLSQGMDIDYGADDGEDDGFDASDYNNTWGDDTDDSAGASTTDDGNKTDATSF